MPMVKCECGWRGNKRFLAVHQKSCIRRKRILKSEFNQRVTQTLDYRVETLSKFEIDTKGLDLTKMPDIAFNDLVFRLEVLQKEKLQKESELEKKKLLDEEAENRLKLELEEKEKLELERIKKEEQDRIEQMNRVSESEKQIISKKENLEKSFIEKREKLTKEKSKEEIIKSDIQTIDNLIEKSIGNLPQKEVKRKGRPKKVV